MEAVQKLLGITTAKLESLPDNARLLRGFEFVQQIFTAIFARDENMIKTRGLLLNLISEP